jgi:error-prone DNA polymerase
MPEYAELHCHSNFSFQEGASSIRELVARAHDLGYPALALTDHDNLCGAMEFAQWAGRLGVRPITGVEVTLQGASARSRSEAQAHSSTQSESNPSPGHMTLLATSATGYSNVSRLLSLGYATSERRDPKINPWLLPEHAEGVIALSGCARGPIPKALVQGRFAEAKALAVQCVEWYGEGNFYLELQQNLVHGDTLRNRRLVALGRELGIPLVATNNVHYHERARHRLQDCLVAIHSRKSLEQSHRERRANAELYLKAPERMARLFREVPESIANTMVIADRCRFDLTHDLTYRFPDYDVPDGFTQLSYLERLCREVAHRKYGGIDERIETRLREELRVIEKRNLAGFFLIYHDIIEMAREVQVELGLVDSEVPLDEAPPGRGRGSSVAMLVGYLTGLSHIDPLLYDLSLERFLPEDADRAPDIDLDFPRNIREELIKRVHSKWGWDHAALTGMISTYKIRGVVRDLGMALGLPADDIDKLAKQVDHMHARDLQKEMRVLPGFRNKIDAPGWRDLIDLAKQLDGFPRNLAQHPGGMIISSTPLIDQVPVQQSAIDGRYLCHWDKDSIADAGFVKIDFLALGALSQMQEAVQLIEERTGQPCDLSRIDFEDEEVYDMLARADTIGIFQVESAAQIQTIPRIRPKNLVDMAHEVAAVRPGVGVNDGVSEYIRRRVANTMAFDHEIERRALERTRGVILFQDQINQLAIDVGGFPAKDADQLRRAYHRRDDADAIHDYWWPRFRDGAHARGVDEAIAARIFRKFNGQYMFPEAHAFAFGVNAYQMSWLKYYYPLEFYVGLFNQQPMGFYNLETLKEDAKRHGIHILHPDVNRSAVHCVPEAIHSIRLGLLHVRAVGKGAAETVVREREAHGPYASVADLMARSGLLRESLDNLTDAGALDGLNPLSGAGQSTAGGKGVPPSLPNVPRVGSGDVASHIAARQQGGRRGTRWEIGLRYRPAGAQLSLPLPVEQDMVPLPEASAWTGMEREYRTIGLHPAGHVMAYLRDSLPGILTSRDVGELNNGTQVRVAGLVIRRQRPLAKAVFITLEDEFGHTPLVIWPSVYERFRMALKEPFLIADGVISHREGTMNIAVTSVKAIEGIDALPLRSKDWG